MGSAGFHQALSAHLEAASLRRRVGPAIAEAVQRQTRRTQVMAEHDAVFSGEHSGQYHFRDFWRADTGMLTALHVLAALGEQDRPLSELVADYSRYAASGEINFEVSDIPGTLGDATAGRLVGLTVAFTDGRWFNLRPSNTERLVRLNVEGPATASLTALRDEVLGLVCWPTAPVLFGRVRPNSATRVRCPSRALVGGAPSYPAIRRWPACSSLTTRSGVVAGPPLSGSSARVRVLPSRPHQSPGGTGCRRLRSRPLV
ncbi:hypothetical protein ACH4FX_42990 [Streptomyces sp. NPDC018019]|uniref:hypothetical protein n=1 Tax=Streptomyces sp. NPDC018019 TaxID=3365030 RepID=UPI003788CFC1